NADEGGQGGGGCDTLGDPNCMPTQPPPPLPPPDCGPGEGLSRCHKQTGELSEHDVNLLFPRPKVEEVGYTGLNFYSGYDTRVILEQYFHDYIYTGMVSYDPRVKQKAYD